MLKVFALSVVAGGAAATTAKVAMGAYPGTATGVRGFVRVDSDEHLEVVTITGTVAGLEASVTGAGIHVHTGFSCEDASLVLDHYFEDGTVDPWLVTTYDTDANGIAAVSLVVPDFTMKGRLPIAGRALVLHASNGDRVGCGLVEPTSGSFVSFETYPGYSGTYEPVGTLLVTDAGSTSVAIEGTVAGLEMNATGGLHVHEGFNCDDAGGHYFEGSDDPWLTTTYTTDVDGVDDAVSLLVAPYTLHGEFPVAHRAVVLHESDGTRVACGLLGATAVDEAPTTASTATIRAKVAVGSYPGTTNDVKGFVKIDSDEDAAFLKISGTVTGLEPSVTGAGVHVHTGFTCDNATEVLGHYFEEGTVDPWLVTTYDTDANGNAAIDLEVPGFTMAGTLPIAGRAFVLHAANGDRVGCGLISPTTGDFASFETYPGYAGVSEPVGTVLVTDAGSSSVAIEGTVAGLEASATGGFHIHEGYNCDAAGGHYFEEGADDPWLVTTYATDANGVDDAVSLLVAPYTLRQEYPVAHRAVVLHEADGTRVACGLLGAAAATSANATAEGPTPAATTARAKVTMGSYPGLTNGVTGFLRVDSDEDAAVIMITGTVAGLEPSVTAGVHVHYGFSCDESSLVLGHFFEMGTEDLWLQTTYTSDASGVAAISVTVPGYTMKGAWPVAGRAVVLHADNGDPVGCGLIEPTSGEFVSFQTYPGYSGTYEQPVGTMLVSDAGASTIALEGVVAGLEASATGGVHVHEGYNCENSGGHYFQEGTVDPWLETTYSTDANGVGVDFSLTVSPYTLRQEYPVAYRAVVLHESDGTRVACGILGAAAAAFQATTAAPSASPSTVGGPGFGDDPIVAISSKKSKKRSGTSTTVVIIIAVIAVVVGCCGGLCCVLLVAKRRRNAEESRESRDDDHDLKKQETDDLELPVVHPN